ncbi:hypothetical protein PRZ48_003300 [Zasmidium cellare]|uniref:Uncharacterized protein n=1 Tax=Zasmidium cellare TaxID=395010 RepID=A0ABR0EUN6_ZASCE|nr:hypothetical protein PRZ48_003300 [Zasmidium cellare]
MVTGGGSSYFSSISGPELPATSWTWRSAYSRVTVGTVYVTVDQVNSQTVTSTSYNSDQLQYITSGTLTGSDALHSRTDTNAAGTVTGVIYDGSERLTVTKTYSTLPFQQPIPTTTASIEPDDPNGLYYQLVPATHNAAPAEIAQFWKGPNFPLSYDGCHYAMCPDSNISIPAPAYSATWQNAQAYLLATSTTTLSSIDLNGGGGGGGPTTTPEAQHGPTTTPTNTPPQADQDSQVGNTTPPPPPPTHSEQAPSTPTDPLPPPNQDSQQGGNPPESTPTYEGPGVILNPGASTPGQQAPSGGEQQPPAPVITIGASAITPNSADQYIVAGQTLAPGSAIEVSGTTYSLPSGGSQLVVGTETQHIGPAVTESPNGPSNSLPTFNVGGSSVTANSASQYVVGGQTLAPGSAIVVSGTTISLASGGSQLVVGSSTVSGPSDTAATTTTSASSSSSSSQTPATQTNGATRDMRISLPQVCLMMVLLLFLTV